MDLVRYLKRSLFGRTEARREWHTLIQQSQLSLERLEETLARYQPPIEDAEPAPLFILSAGWRSGSTLVQRLVCSNPEQKTLVWGEPYDLCNTIQRLTESLLPITQHWPPPEYFISKQAEHDLTQTWIANLYPPLSDLWSAHRAMLDSLFAKPAAARGYPSWGLKEVRLSVEHARYLRWLYPQARFLFLCRNPVDAYASYADRRKLWFDRWPHVPMLTARDFGRHWDRLAKGFYDARNNSECLFIRYEDLTTNSETLHALEQFLGHPIDRAVLNTRIGGSDGSKPVWASKLDRLIIRHTTGRTAARLGYALK